MKKALRIILAILVFAVVAFYGFKYYTKSHSPQETVAIEQNGIEIEIEYSRPFKKGRDIFGGLVPYDKVWRTGANEATTISFNKDVFIQGERLPEGEYSLWTIPNPENWTVIFNNVNDVWGTNYDEAGDVLKVQAAPTELSKTVEQFTITVAGTDSLINLNLSWDNTLVTVPIK